MCWLDLIHKEMEFKLLWLYTDFQAEAREYVEVSLGAPDSHVQGCSLSDAPVKSLRDQHESRMVHKCTGDAFLSTCQSSYAEPPWLS